MTPQELKNSILQLAIAGKLVEQRAEEGTAEELFAQIQAEKQRLVAEGKLKKQKPLPEITEDEKAFDIPESWKWVRLGEVCKSIADGDHQAPPQVTTGIPFLVISNVSNGRLDFANTRFVPQEYFQKINNERIAEYGDLLFTVTGSYGIPIKVDCENSFCFQRHIALLKLLLDWDFVYYLLKTPLIKSQCDKKATGTAQKTVGLNTLKSLAFPLPPLAEQKRIVAKIEQLVPYIERYEKAWSRLQEFNKRFPSDMQKSLLQYAIEGKLVEQRAEEGTAEELFTQIQAEKLRLVAEGKLKKQKPLPEITEEEKPFDIPESWKWVRLGEVGNWGSGATPSRTNPDYYGGKIPWLKTGDLNDGYITNVPEFITELALEKTSVRLNPVGSVLIAMYGATIGKLGILKIPMTTNQACCACIPFNGIYNVYLFYFLMAYRTRFIKMGEGGAQPNISREKIINSILPLPPLAEQKRIVARLEELLPLCDRLKK